MLTYKIQDRDKKKLKIILYMYASISTSLLASSRCSVQQHKNSREKIGEGCAVAK